MNQTAGHVGFYCNPSWGGQPQTGSNIAQSGNAVWQTGILTFSECSSCASAPRHVRTMIQMYRCGCLAVVCKVQDACMCLLQLLLLYSPLIASKLQRLLPCQTHTPRQQTSCKPIPVCAISMDSVCLMLSFLNTNTVCPSADDAWFDSLTISANDASYLPTNSSTTSAILAGLSTSASTYQPAFNCSVRACPQPLPPCLNTAWNVLPNVDLQLQVTQHLKPRR